MNPIIKYWQEIQNGLIVSEKIRRLYEKLNADLSDADSEWEYSEGKAQHAIDFIEKFCRHSKGKSGGQPLILEIWQLAMVAATFGFVHKIDRTRKYREVILIVARKNGKSTLSAAIGLYLMIADGEAGAEIYSLATKKDQAKIIWLEAKRMVKKSPALRRKIKPLVSEMVADYNDGVFRPLGSDSETQDGLNVHGALPDEIHAWKNKSLYDVVVDGMTAREQPLIFVTTTAGTVRESIYDIKYDECQRIINKFGQEKLSLDEERLLPIIYEIDSRPEWTDAGCWMKANPGLGTIKSLDQLRDKVSKAQKNALLIKNLLCKDFNIRETVSEAWLTFEQLNNTAVYNLAMLKPDYAIGGCDLSSTTDLTCATIIFKVKDDPTIYVKQMYWLPEDLIETRESDDKIPYTIWRDMGLMRTTPGNKVHYQFVVEWFEEMRNEHDIYIPWIGYDGWSATYFVEEMKKTFGADVMIPVIQGKKTLSGPMHALGADLAANKINYNNSGILKWCISNTAIEVDKNLNIQPCKTHNQRRRIDGLASLLNAYVIYELKREEYENMV